MATWIIKCDPKVYRLSDRLSDPNNTITWLVTRYKNDIQPGDIVFLRSGFKTPTPTRSVSEDIVNSAALRTSLTLRVSFETA